MRRARQRSEEHTSELQSRSDLVCRLLLEKKNNLEDAIFPNAPDSDLEHLLGGLEPSVGALAFAHLHIAYTRRWRHLLLADVASCGLPRDDDLRAAYGILTWQDHSWEAEIRRVVYDVKAVVKQIKMSGIPNVEKRIKVLTEARY